METPRSRSSARSESLSRSSSRLGHWRNWLRWMDATTYRLDVPWNQMPARGYRGALFLVDGRQLFKANAPHLNLMTSSLRGAPTTHPIDSTYVYPASSLTTPSLSEVLCSPQRTPASASTPHPRPSICMLTRRNSICCSALSKWQLCSFFPEFRRRNQG